MQTQTRRLKYAILGLLNREPLTGYDIAKSFAGRLSRFWEAKHSQIYTELQRLEKDGEVEFTVEIQGEKMEKKVYTITDKGRKELMEWLLVDEPLGTIPKDSFRLRIYFGENLNKEQQQIFLRKELEKHQALLHLLQRCGAKYKEVPPLKSDDFSEYLLIRGGIYREQGYIDWIMECFQLTETIPE